MRVLIDMNMSPRWVEALAAEGHEAVHWSTVGSPSAEDEEIMEFARVGGYIVLTHDLDFTTILATSKASKPSVIQFRSSGLRPERLKDSLLRTLRMASKELEEGALITLDERRQRMHILPIGDPA